jgi:hypothetical protein
MTLQDIAAKIPAHIPQRDPATQYDHQRHCQHYRSYHAVPGRHLDKLCSPG